MDNHLIFYSDNNDNSLAFQDIVNQIGESENPILILFTCDKNSMPFYNEQLSKKYKKSQIAGCSSFINFTSEGFSHYGISGIAIYSGIEVSCGIIQDISRYPMKHVKNITSALKKIKTKENTICFEMITANSLGEELVLDTLNEGLKNTDIPIVGCSAGCESTARETYVSLNGNLYENTCIFILIHNLNGKIHIFKENLFKPTNTSLITTDVVMDERKVYEFDGIPATTALMKTLNVTKDELYRAIKMHPLGRVRDDEIYITHPNEIFDDGSISYYARIYNQNKVYILEMQNTEEVWEQTKQKVADVCPNISFSISINCMARSRQFESSLIFQKFVSTLKDNYGDFFGISGFGEQLAEMHFNYTMILIVFE